MSEPIKVSIEIKHALMPYLSEPARSERKALIEDILKRGQIAVFTAKSGLIKKVNEWIEEPASLDIKAFDHNGNTEWTMWDAIVYTVSEEPPGSPPLK